jgi:hypothetical protein
MSLLRLKAAVGRLSEADIVQISTWFDKPIEPEAK